MQTQGLFILQYGAESSQGCIDISWLSLVMSKALDIVIPPSDGNLLIVYFASQPEQDM